MHLHLVRAPAHQVRPRPAKVVVLQARHEARAQTAPPQRPPFRPAA